MKYLIAILLFASTALAQNNSGTLVIAPIRPQAVSDTFPSAIANEIQGGPFSVGTLTAMSNIPSARLVSGATAYVTNDAGLRLWNGTNWSAGNFRNAIGLGDTNNVSFTQVAVSKNDLTTSMSGFGGFSFEADGTNYSSVFSFEGDEAANLQALARANLGLGATNEVEFLTVQSTDTITGDLTVDASAVFGAPIEFGGTNSASNAATTRTNLGLGATNNVTFSSITLTQITNTINLPADFQVTTDDVPFFNNDNGFTLFSDAYVRGNIVLTNQTATNNGLLFIYRTNSEPFLGLANLIASNNTTISNETLFRVGVAEATNKAAQFGFRSTNTNGDGVAVFSTFGYNALMMIGPSVRSATNTNGIEADIYSISPTNKVATLIDTNTGATLMHRPVGFNTNASAPANTTNVAGWIQIYVGTNNVRVPYYQ
jgi:hypothetical protein